MVLAYLTSADMVRPAGVWCWDGRPHAASLHLRRTQVFPVDKTVTVVGRAPESDLQLESRSVSWRLASILAFFAADEPK